MKIVLRPKEGRKELLTLFVDEEQWTDLHISIFGRRPKFSASSEEELQKQIHDLEYAGARRFAWRRLAMRSYHSAELQSALEERLVSEKVISKVLGELINLGYINDQEWVQNSVSRLSRQKKGAKAIVNTLRSKGIDTKSVELAVESICQADSEQENIAKLVKTKYRSRDLTDRKERQKVVASLARKGYSFSDIFAVLGDLE